MPKDASQAIENANEEALRELREGAQEEEAQGPEPEVVGPEDPEDKEEPDPQPARGQEKRRNRYREQVAAREATEKENQDLKIRLAALEAARQYAPQVVPGQQPQEDPHEAKIKKLKEEQERCVKTYRAISGDTEEAQTAREEQRLRYIALQDDLSKAHVEQVLASQNRAPNTSAEVRLEMYRQRYSDVVNHPSLAGVMLEFANARWMQERALLRHRNGGRDVEVPLEVMDRVFEEARRIAGIAKSPAPSPQVKARFSGSGPGPRASNGIQDVPSRKEFPMNKQYLRMARAAHPGKPDKVAFQLWVNDQQD